MGEIESLLGCRVIPVISNVEFVMSKFLALYCSAPRSTRPLFSPALFTKAVRRKESEGICRAKATRSKLILSSLSTQFRGVEVVSSFEVESFNRRVMAVSDKSTVLKCSFLLGQVYTIGVQVKLSQESFDFHTFNHSPGVNLYVPEVDRLYQYLLPQKGRARTRTVKLCKLNKVSAGGFTTSTP